MALIPAYLGARYTLKNDSKHKRLHTQEVLR